MNNMAVWEIIDIDVYHFILKEGKIVKNLASFNGQNKKVESSAEIYRDQSLV